MPNYCECELKVSGDPELVDRILVAIRGKDDAGNEFAIDFNKIIPKPQSLSVEASSLGTEAYAAWHQSPNEDLQKKLLKQNPDAEKIANAYKSNMEQYGHHTWYSWCVEKWGTKWNAGDVLFRDGKIEFSTAWSPPLPVIIALGEQYPEASFTLKYWEGGAGFKGTLSIKKGKIVKNEQTTYKGRRGG